MDRLTKNVDKRFSGALRIKTIRVRMVVTVLSTLFFIYLIEEKDKIEQFLE